MKKQVRNSLLIFSMLFAGAHFGNAQNVVLNLNFDGYLGTSATVPAGFYFSWNNNTTNSFYTSAGNYGAASPSYKFGNDGDFIVTPMVQSADSLTFWSKGNGSPFSPLNELRIYHSTDSVTWMLDNTLVPLSASATTMSVPLNQTSGYFKFEYYKAPSGGNLAFDDLKIYSTLVSDGINLTREDPILVYPAPTTGLLNISIAGNPQSTPIVEVFDILGNNIQDVHLERKGRGIFTIDLTGKTRGFYFVKIQTGRQFVTKRITVTN